MKSPRLCCALACAPALLIGGARQVCANVFAAHLEPAATSWNFTSGGPLTLSYRLNEAATSVAVEIYRASDPGTVIKTIGGTTTRGLNSVQWDGTDSSNAPVIGGDDFQFRVVAADAVGKSAWTNITPTSGGSEIGSAQYWAPVGVAVNRDPASPHFGRIYVCSSHSTNASTNPGASAKGDGLFLLNSDLTFHGGSDTTAFAAANSQLITNGTGTNSPFKIAINPDNPDEIVMGDFSDTWENVWIFDGTGTTVSRILDASTSGPTAGEAYNHGNAISVALTGVGADRKLWIIDEDRDHGDPRIGAMPDLVRFDIGETAADYTGPGVEIINGGATQFETTFNSGRDLKFGRVSGTSRVYLTCQNAANDPGALAVVCYTLDANGLPSGRLWSLDNPTLTTATGVTPVWTLTGPIAVDEAHGRGAAGIEGLNLAANNRSGRVVIFNTETGAVLASFDAGSSATARSLRAMDFDAAGNLYTGNQTDEHVRMWSPPDGPNSYTTAYHGLLQINCGVPTPTISAQSGDTGACAGSLVELSVTADGHGEPLTYIWKRGDITVGTESTLTFNPVTTDDIGIYTVTVTGCGSVVSEPISLSVFGEGSITQQPASAGHYAGETAVFTVAVSTVGTATYQWRQTVNGTTTDVGTNSPMLTIDDVAPGLNGATYTVEIGDSACPASITSAQASLYVLLPPCPLLFADTDRDGDVDQSDYGTFQRCLDDEPGYDPVACKCLDQAEPFGVIDAGGEGSSDLSAFLACFSGPAIPAHPVCGRATLFADDFDTAASASDWTAVGTTDDHTVTFAFDYAVLGIPSAPNAADPGTHKGLYVSVNDRDDPDTDPLEAAAAFTHMSFSGDYTVQFDMWMQYDGTFTTEHAMMGVNATIPAGPLTVPTVGTASLPATGPVANGYYFAVDGEAGDNWRDYRTYEDGVELLAAAGGYAGGNQNALDGVFPTIFPSPKSAFPGVPGNSKVIEGQWAGWGWARVEIQQRDGKLTWKMNDVPVAADVPVTTSVSGSVLLGHMDLYASVNTGTFVIFDNLIVLTP